MALLTVTPNQSDIQAALRAFLLDLNLTCSPPQTSVDVILGQVNRVPEPLGPDFIEMWATRRERLETNIDTYADVAFTATIAGNVMTVLSVQLGVIAIGSGVFGVGVQPNTLITGQLSGSTGGSGTYSVNPMQTITSPQIMAAGVGYYLQPTKVTVQCDVHGPNSADNAQVISTLFRDEYAVDLIQAINPAITPLYADDPKQIPFINAEQQYETRWIVEALLQANQTVAASQEFADKASVGLIDVDVVYPP